jgi:bla regulator protein blaR1
MIPVDLSPFENHLWQSSLCTVGVWMLTLALKKNRAAVRYWLWLAASVKFLLPFSLLFSIGGQLGWRSAPAIAQPQLSIAINEISRPFTVSAEVLALPAASRALGELPVILIGAWLCGFTLGLIFWVRSLRQICAIEHAAKPLNLNLPIPVMSLRIPVKWGTDSGEAGQSRTKRRWLSL